MTKDQKIIHWMAFSLLLVINGLPLLACIFEILHSPPQPSPTFVDLGVRQYLLRGAIASVGSALVATVLGTLLALTGIPVKARWLAVIGLSPLMIPPTVYGLAWNALWAMPQSSILSFIRVSLCMGLAFTPLVLLITLAARSLQDPAMEEAARLAAMVPRQKWLWVNLAPLARASAAGGLATFLLAFSSFEIPSALGYRSFPEAIYQRFQQTNTLGAPATLSLLGALPAVILAMACWRHLNRHGSHSLQFRPRLPLNHSAWSWGIWSLFLAVAILLPSMALAARVGAIGSLSAMKTDLLEGLRDTLPVVFSAILLCLVLGWGLTDFILERRKLGMAALLIIFLGTGIAPAVIGIGLIRAWIQFPRGGFIYGTNAAFVLALVARYLALPTLVFAAVRKILPPSFEEPARLAGMNFLRRQYHIMLPVLASTGLAVTSALFALMLGELGATTLLASPGTELLSFRLHSRVHIGPESYVAAFSLLYATMVLALAWLFLRLGQWMMRENHDRSS